MSTAELGGLCSFLVEMEESGAHGHLDACPDYSWNPSSPACRAQWNLVALGSRFEVPCLALG